MPLRRGTVAIGGLRRGSTVIGRAFIGSTQVFGPDAGGTPTPPPPPVIPTNMDEMWTAAQAQLQSAFRFTFGASGQERYNAGQSVGTLAGSFNDPAVLAPNLNRVRSNVFNTDHAQTTLNQPGGAARETSFSDYVAAQTSPTVYVLWPGASGLRYLAMLMMEEPDGWADGGGIGGGFFRSYEGTFNHVAVQHLWTDFYDWRDGPDLTEPTATMSPNIRISLNFALTAGRDCIIGFAGDAVWKPLGDA